MQVKDLMKQAYAIQEDMSLEEAAKFMSSKNIGCVVYVQGDKLLGILTERDILKNFGRKKLVSEVMAQKVLTVKPDDPIEIALEVMKENMIKRLPVIEDNKLLGIITLTSLAYQIPDLEGDFFFD